MTSLSSLSQQCVVKTFSSINLFLVRICVDSAMEKALKKEVDEVMSQPSVTGILCVDSGGLCVAAHGSASKTSSGLVSALASQAAALRPDAPAPVIVLESDAATTLIKSHSGTTVAVFKSPATANSMPASADVNR